jgi:peroxiredoxin
MDEISDKPQKIKISDNLDHLEILYNSGRNLLTNIDENGKKSVIMVMKPSDTVICRCGSEFLEKNYKDHYRRDIHKNYLKRLELRVNL